MSSFPKFSWATTKGELSKNMDFLNIEKDPPEPYQK